MIFFYFFYIKLQKFCLLAPCNKVAAAASLHFVARHAINKLKQLIYILYVKLQITGGGVLSNWHTKHANMLLHQQNLVYLLQQQKMWSLIHVSIFLMGTLIMQICCYTWRICYISCKNFVVHTTKKRLTIIYGWTA